MLNPFEAVGAGADNGGAPPQLPPREGRRASVTKIVPPNTSNPFPMMVVEKLDTAKPIATPPKAQIRGPTDTNPFPTVKTAAPFPAQKPAGAKPNPFKKANPFKKKAEPHLSKTPAATPAATPAVAVAPAVAAAAPRGATAGAAAGGSVPRQNFDSSDDDSDSDTDSDEDNNPFHNPKVAAAPKVVPPRPTSNKPPPVARKPGVPPPPTHKIKPPVPSASEILNI